MITNERAPTAPHPDATPRSRPKSLFTFRSSLFSLLSALFFFPFCLAGCKESPPGTAPPARWELFSPALIGKWREATIHQGGGVRREPDGFTIREGAPITGLVFPSWLDDGLPVANYAIEYEAMRVSGGDFFGSVTFPVRDAKTFVTFVLGGWGGSQVGISCIDGYDASENPTGSSQRLENGKWYRVRIEVRPRELTVLLDGRRIIRTNIAGRDLSLRAGEIDQCVPFGFATYGTEGRVRDCAIERLAAP